MLFVWDSEFWGRPEEIGRVRHVRTGVLRRVGCLPSMVFLCLTKSIRKKHIRPTYAGANVGHPGLGYLVPRAA